MKESRNNRKWLGVIALAAMVAIVMSGCKKDEAQAYMGHEVIFTDCVGATYGTSELLCGLGREEVTEDIYFERGVYWCRGEAGYEWMETAVNNLKKMWKENGDVNIDIDNINDLPQLAGTLLQLNAIVSLFQEYDVKFNYKGNGSFN